MRIRGKGAVALVIGLVVAGLVGAGSAGAAPSDRAGAREPGAFWTHAKVAQAKPRDFVYDPASGRFVPSERAKGKPGGGTGGSGGSTTVLGASWTGSGLVKTTTGKVLFAFGSSYYVCSASVVTDISSSTSTILTAAHCAADEATGELATHWTFIPDYDSAPAPLSTSNEAYCPQTRYGCWEAAAIFVDSEYLTAGAFNNQAVLHDFAFVRAGTGGHSGTDQLDAIAGSQAISFAVDGDRPLVGKQGWAFGYPASGKYKGNDLVYSAGTVGTDPSMGGQTYAIGSNMTGGSSGGPWFGSDFNASSGAGTLGSVNSYGYSGVAKMHGPVLNSEAQALYDAATDASPAHAA